MCNDFDQKQMFNFANAIAVSDEMDFQRIHISWIKPQAKPEYYNVTIQSNDKDFFAKKTVSGVSVQFAFVFFDLNFQSAKQMKLKIMIQTWC